MSTGLKANSDGSAAIQVGGTDVITLTSGGAATFVTSPTTVQAGTAAAPSITFSGDTNTGIYSPGADQVAIATGGTAAIYANSSQNVGIGTTSPASKLHVTGLARICDPAAYLLFRNAADTTSNGVVQFPDTGDASIVNYRNTGLTLGTNNNTRITITNGGDVGIGTTSPSFRLDIQGVDGIGGLTSTTGTNTVNWRLINSGGTLFTGIDSSTGGNFTGTAYAGVLWHSGNYPLVFATNNTQRARITPAGAFVVAKTSAVLSTAGSYLQEDGFIGATRSSNAPLGINRLTNDGDLIFFQQDNTQEGSISVSGTTVSYNGGHLSRYAQTQAPRDESILKGTVLSNLDEMNVYVRPTTYWTEEDELPEGVSVGDVKEESAVVANEQLNKVKVSDVEGDVNVAGVFVNWTYDEQHQVDEINMAMTGDMIIRIAQSVSVQKGDLLMSAGDGTAKPQGDDIVRSKTVAKVTSNHVTCTYEDGSYCVPCVLMAC